MTYDTCLSIRKAPSGIRMTLLARSRLEALPFPAEGSNWVLITIATNDEINRPQSRDASWALFAAITVPPVYRTKAFARQVRERLEPLEEDGKYFAEFQSAFFKAAIELADEAKLANIRQFIAGMCEQAVPHGLS